MTVDIEEIEMGERRREDYGDLAGLGASIRRYGLIHPIVVDEKNRLIAGGRRLEACRILGWAEVEVRDFGELTEAERREIELEENLRRKDLTPYEQAKELVRKAERFERDLSSKIEETLPTGRPSKYAVPKEEIAKAHSVSVGTLVNREQLVATADAYPELKGPEWKQSYVLAFKENLEKLPEQDRAAAVAMVMEDIVIPKKAVLMLDNLGEKTPQERTKIFDLHQSGDQRKHDAAMSMTVSGRVFPDLRSPSLKTVIDELKGCIKMFPDDVMVPRFRAVIEELSKMKAEIERLHEERIHGAAAA
jgi:ParB-like chromosome segregation protein Spo0J